MVLPDLALERLRDGAGFVHGDLYVTGTEEAPVALRLRCTHLGCRLRHDPKARALVCACHGSRFDLDGRVLAGPARRPLERVALR